MRHRAWVIAGKSGAFTARNAIAEAAQAKIQPLPLASFIMDNDAANAALEAYPPQKDRCDNDKGAKWHEKFSDSCKKLGKARWGKCMLYCFATSC